MSKHLVQHSADITSTIPFEEVGTLEYLKLRVQFWKWRKKRTMGRPALLLWREPAALDGEKE